MQPKRHACVAKVTCKRSLSDMACGQQIFKLIVRSKRFCKVSVLSHPVVSIGI